METQVLGITEHFDGLCEQIEMTRTTHAQLRRRAVLQDVAAVAGHAVGGGGFGRGGDGKLEFGKAAHAAAMVLPAMRRGGKSRRRD